MIDGSSPSLLYSVLVYHKHLRTIGFYLKSNTVCRDLQVLQKTTTIITLTIVETETTHKVNSFALDSSFRYQKEKNLNTTGTSYRQNLLLVLDETKVVDVVVEVVKF